ncbi:MAG TPA: hypothetical protein VF010_11620, partial [Methylomirabilota bacterium]|nr:hypothetical protein [Methylomirabilota bacterium]
MTLDEIVDQPRAVEQLRRALAGGRVAHAYAFVGPAGSGRFTTALAFAAALLCEACGATPRLEQATRASNRAGATRSNRCVCAAAAARQHPDLHVVAPTPPDSNPKGARAIRIGAVRELERQASLRPVMARRRMLVLDEAERMTDDAPQ